MNRTTNPIKIALVGNPNIGKTTLFNKLCGLNQRTGNYPGVTIDKKIGKVNNVSREIELIDLPGINSMFPNSKDEELVVKYLLNKKAIDYPDKLIVVVSAINLKRNLYLFDQIRDLNVPIILAINMTDLALKRGVAIDIDELKKRLQIPIVLISAKNSDGIDELKGFMCADQTIESREIHYLQEDEISTLHEYASFRNSFFDQNDIYAYFLELTSKKELSEADQLMKEKFLKDNEIDQRRLKTNSSILRYKHINTILSDTVKVDKSEATDLTTRLDRIFLHPIFGYIIFGLILFGIFQAIFWLASYPMDLIDMGFANLSTGVNNLLPEGYFTRLLTEGLIPGLGGVIIFIPQIAILFLLFSILEESGYMSRIVYLTDRLMQRFGMSGKSMQER